MNWELPRDFVGYGPNPPHAAWPNGARIAVQLVMNYEEGGENSVQWGDEGSETFLSEMIGAPCWVGERHPSMESIYDYGARAGVWRLLRLFERKGVPVTVYAVAQAAAKNPEAIKAFAQAGHEIASHGLRWIDYRRVPENVEREHIAKAVEILTEIVGERPLGWYTGRTSINTRRLVAEHGGFLYDADAYDDDLPYWQEVNGAPQLVIPYTLDSNDMRFAAMQGFNCGDQFLAYLRDAFDVLYAEGADRPKMLSVGLHCRLVGRPGRLAALERFIDHAQSHDKVWFCRRVDIARHWREKFPFEG